MCRTQPATPLQSILGVIGPKKTMSTLVCVLYRVLKRVVYRRRCVT